MPRTPWLSAGIRWAPAARAVADAARSGLELREVRAIAADAVQQLYVEDEFLGRTDVWWRDAGVAGEVDSREWHLSPAQWEQTMIRHARMSAAGIIVIHVMPRRIRIDGAKVLAEFRSAIDAGRKRPPLPIRTVSAKGEFV